MTVVVPKTETQQNTTTQFSTHNSLNMNQTIITDKSALKPTLYRDFFNYEEFALYCVAYKAHSWVECNKLLNKNLNNQEFKPHYLCEPTSNSIESLDIIEKELVESEPELVNEDPELTPLPESVDIPLFAQAYTQASKTTDEMQILFCPHLRYHTLLPSDRSKYATFYQARNWAKCKQLLSKWKNAQKSRFGKKGLEAQMMSDYIPFLNMYKNTNRASANIANMTDPTGPVGDILTNVANTSAGVQSIVDKIAALTAPKDATSKVLAIASICALYVQTPQNLTSTIAFLSAIALQFDIASNVVTLAVKKFTDFVQGNRPAQAQAFTSEETQMDSPSIFSMVAETICSFFGVPADGISLLKRITMLGAGTTAITKIAQLSKVVYEWVRDAFYKYKYGVSYALYRETTNYEKLGGFIECCAILHTIELCHLDRSRELCQTVLDIFEIGNQLMYETRSDMSLRNYVGSLCRQIVKIYEYASRSPAMSKTLRRKPFTIYLYGKAGTGKTALSQILNAKLYRKFHKGKVPGGFAKCSFTRKTENEYWDGYHGQPYVRYDDIYQVKDSTSLPNPEIMESIRVINDDPYHLHMASVEDKKNTYFTSEFILATSNSSKPEVKSLMCPSAIFRRWNHSYEVKVRSEFGRLDEGYLKVDEAKVKAAQSAGGFMEDIYEIQRYDMSGSHTTAIGQPLSFQQFYDQIESEAIHHRSSSGTFVESLARIAGEEIVGDEEEESTAASYVEKLKIATSSQFSSQAATTQRNGYVESSITSVLYLRELKRKGYNLAKNLSPDSLKKHIEDAWREWHSAEVFGTDEAGSDDGLREDLHHNLPMGDTSAGLNEQHEETDESSWRDVFSTDFFSDLPKNFTERWDAIHEATIKHLKTIKDSVLKGLKAIGNYILEHLTTILAFLVGSAVGLHCYYAVKPKSCVLTTFTCSNDLLTTTGCMGEYGKDCLDCGIVLKERDAVFSGYTRALYEDYNVLNDLLRDCVSAFDNPATQEQHRVFVKLLTNNKFPNFRNRHPHKQVKIPYSNNATVQSEDYKESHKTRQKNAHVAHSDYKEEQKTKTKRNATITHTSEPKRLEEDTDEVEAFMTDEIREILHSTQAGDLSSQEVLTKVNMKNSVIVKSANNGAYVTGTFIKGRLMMVPHHFYNRYILDCEAFYFQTSLMNNQWQRILTKDIIGSLRMTTPSSDVLDAVIICMPKTVTCRPNIAKYFVPASDFNKVDDGCLMISGLKLVNNRATLNCYTTNVAQVNTKSFSYEEPEGMNNRTTYTANRSISYYAPTCPGDCGSLVFLRNKASERKILGLHVAGCETKGEGLAEAVSSETLEYNLRKLEETYKNSYHLFTQAYDATNDALINTNAVTAANNLRKLGLGDDDNFQPVGCLVKAPAMPLISKVAPSEIHNLVHQTKMAPAKLKRFRNEEGELVNPMIRGVKKLTTKQSHVDDELLKIVSNNVYNHFPIADDDLNRVCTYAEAVTGIEGREFCGGIDRKTSPGFPYNVNNPGSGKQHWFGREGEYDLSNQEIRNDVENLIEKAKTGKRSRIIYVATLKDEKRSLEKVKAGKTRLFAGAPMHFSIAFRMYFLGFMESTMKNRNNNSISIGTNVNSLDWHKIGEILQSKGSKVVDGDYQSYDSALLAKLLWEQCDIVNKWYDDGEENARIRSVLFEDIVNAVIAVEGNLIQLTHSQPSGNPFTAILNSMVNMTIVRYCYLLCKKAKQIPLPRVCDFDKHVSMVCYGDDVVMNISDEIISWFNFVTMQANFKEFGFIFTDAAKTGVVVEYKTLGEVDYLKRAFVRDPETNLFIAPLQIDVIHEIPQWHKTNIPKQATIDNIETALRDYAVHGRDVYEEQVRLYRKACNVKKLKAYFPEWREVMDETFECRGQNATLKCQSGHESSCDLTNSQYTQLKESEVLLRTEQKARLLRRGSLTLARQSGEEPLIKSGRSEIPLIGDLYGCRTNAVSDHRRFTEFKKQNNYLLTQAGGDDEVTVSMGTTVTQIEQQENVTTTGSGITPGQAHTEVNDHSLENLLGRATLIKSMNLGGTDLVVPQAYNYSPNRNSQNALGIVYAKDFPSTLFENNPVVVEKLKNFRYIRGDLEFELKYNAQPFTSGGLQMTWFPMAPMTNPDINWQNTTLPGLSSQPHSHQFINEGQSLKLVVPWMHIRDMLETGGSLVSYGRPPEYLSDYHSKDFGTLGISITHAIQEGAAGATISVDLFARWINVSASVPTNGRQTLYENQPVTSVLSDMNQLTLPERQEILDHFSGVLVTQAGPETEQPGIVQKTAGAIANIADVVIPFAPALTPLGWIARSAEKVASAMGWSVPTTTEGIARTSRIPGYGAMHVEGKDTSYNLGINPDGGIIPDGATLEKGEDEESLHYILNRFERNGLNYKAASAGSGWKTTMLPGHQIGIIDAYPRFTPSKEANMSNFYNNIEATTSIQTGCFNYTVGMFNKWRGSLDFELEFAKTNFHQGRLVAVFCPTGEVPDTLGNLMSTNRCFVYDLNDAEDNTGGNRMKFTLPYMNNAPWANRAFAITSIAANGVDHQNYTHNDTRYLSLATQNYQPRIGLYVLTKLQCPDTCSSSIPMTYRIKAGHDFAVAEPEIRYASAYEATDDPAFSTSKSAPDVEFTLEDNVLLFEFSEPVESSIQQLIKQIDDGDIQTIGEWPDTANFPWGEYLIGKTYRTVTDPMVTYYIRKGTNHKVTVQTATSTKKIKAIKIMEGIVEFYNGIDSITLYDLIPKLKANNASITGYNACFLLNSSFANDLSAPFVTQSGWDSTIGSVSIDMIKDKGMDNVKAEATCIGERITSLRSLTKRFAPTTTNSSTWTNDVNVMGHEPLTWRDVVGRMYRFYYGGTRVKFPLRNGEHCTGFIVPDAPITSLRGFQMEEGSYPINVFQGASSNLVKFEGGAEFSGLINNMAEFQLPYYNTARLRLVGSIYSGHELGVPGNTWSDYRVNPNGKGFNGPLGVSMIYDFDKSNTFNWTASTSDLSPYGPAPSCPYYFTPEQATLAESMGIYVNGLKVSWRTVSNRWNWFASSQQPAPLLNSPSPPSFYDFEVSPSNTNTRTMYMASDDTGGFTYLCAPPIFDQLFCNQDQNLEHRKQVYRTNHP